MVSGLQSGVNIHTMFAVYKRCTRCGPLWYWSGLAQLAACATMLQSATCNNAFKIRMPLRLETRNTTANVVLKINENISLGLFLHYACARE